MVYKSVRGWTSGQSLSALNFVKYTPTPTPLSGVPCHEGGLGAITLELASCSVFVTFCFMKRCLTAGQ